jgi:hypothetical protein
MTCVTTQLGRKSEVEGDERGVVESGYSCRNPADDTPTRSLDVVDYPDNAHASTKPIKEGILERKKSTWQS